MARWLSRSSRWRSTFLRRRLQPRPGAHSPPSKASVPLGRRGICHAKSKLTSRWFQARRCPAPLGGAIKRGRPQPAGPGWTLAEGWVGVGAAGADSSRVGRGALEAHRGHGDALLRRRAGDPCAMILQHTAPPAGMGAPLHVSVTQLKYEVQAYERIPFDTAHSGVVGRGSTSCRCRSGWRRQRRRAARRSTASPLRDLAGTGRVDKVGRGG